MNNKDFYLILVRYIILLVITIFGLKLIYIIFTPLTVFLTSKIFDIIYETSINGNLIIINQTTKIYIINACVAGSAYLLLLILNLSMPLEKIKRVKSIIFSFILLFIINVIRIVILGSLYHHKVSYFEFTHAFFWYFLSTIFVILIWIFTIKIFNITKIPFYNAYKKIRYNENFS